MTTFQIRNILTSEPLTSEQLLKRITVCLAAYFDPDQDPEVRAGVRKLYAKALGDIPSFALLKAFATWERTGSRRPSPAEIRTLAERELKPLGDELARRAQIETDQAAEEAERKRNRVTPEAAARIMQEAGFTEGRIAAIRRFPLSKSQSEAVQKMDDFEAPGEHWSDKADPDGPEWAALRASRAASGLLAVKGGDTT